MKSLILCVAFALACSAAPLADEKPKCGQPAVKPDTSKIVGGKDAKPYSWPWQVALFTKPFFGSSYQFCSGTLISNEWVMTAGHCFYGQDSDPTKFSVKLGVFHKNKDTETGEVVASISEIHVNPDFDSGKITQDITLLRLSKPVNYTEHISPVCLPSKQGEDVPADGSDTFVTGWGAVTEGGADSETLKQVQVPIVNLDKCKKSYPGAIYGDCMFCAGLDDGGKDSCQGDSGGPVVVQNNDGSWTQIGIVSWGRGCAERNYYGVYSRVSAYIDFINKITKA